MREKYVGRPYRYPDRVGPLPQPTPEKMAAAISKHLIPALLEQPLTPEELEKRQQR
jgi:hypothetical protein